MSARPCALILASLALLAGCHERSRAAAEAPPPRITLNAESPRPTIDITGVPVDAVNTLPQPDDPEAWRAVMRVTTGTDGRPLHGQYSIVDGVIRFTPMFPLDRGRPYRVTFAPAGRTPITTTVSFPPADITPTTSVIQSFPTMPVVPANLLRIHLVFSAPMSTRDVAGNVHLVDSTGADRTELLLPLDADSWNADRTHCTLIVDPAKSGSLLETEIYTLSVDAAWRDAHGLPLKQPFRRAFTIGAANRTPIDPASWKIEVPPAGSTGSLVIILPEPLDYESLLGVITISGPDKKPIEGRAVIGAGESTWTFAPDEPWQPGAHLIGIVKSLSDPAATRSASCLTRTITTGWLRW